MLMSEIEQQRQKLIQLGMEKGLRHPEVLKLSEYLDALIVKYYQMQACM